MRLRSVAALTAALLLTLAGCSSGSPASQPSPTPTTKPVLSDPIDLDYLSSIIVDDGVGRALVTDWNAQKVRAIDAKGTELWSMPTRVDDERGGAEAYSVGDTVVIHDYSGKTAAYSWADGTERWAYTLPGGSESCHMPEGFGPQTTGTDPILGDGELILLSYYGAIEEPGCQPTSANGNLTVVALDPKTGKEAWPALSVGPKSRTFGGARVNISPDRSTGYLSWEDDGDSALTRIDLGSGKHSTISLEQARSVDDTEFDYYDVMPTTERTPPLRLRHRRSRRPDELSGDPCGGPRPPGRAVAGIEPGHGDRRHYGGGDDDRHLRPGMHRRPPVHPEGEATCVQPQLYASAIKYQERTAD